MFKNLKEMKGLKEDDISYGLLTIYTRDEVKYFRVTKEDLVLLGDIPKEDSSKGYYYDVGKQGD